MSDTIGPHYDTIAGHTVTQIWRYGLALGALLVSAWFALGVRQVRERNDAVRLLANPRTEQLPTIDSALDRAGLLYPGTDVTLFRAQLAMNRRNYQGAKGLIDQATAAEPDDLQAWLTYLRLRLLDPGIGNGALLSHRLRALDPVAFTPVRH